MKKQFRYITSLNLNASNFFDGVGSIVNLAGNSPRYDFLLSGSQANANGFITFNIFVWLCFSI